MKITRCRDQQHETVEEFYCKLADGEYSHLSEAGSAMLELLARLKALADDRLIFGLTSMARLCLLAHDDYKSPWYVIISALDTRNYCVEYLMADDVAPWPNAYVKGESGSTDAASKMIQVAIDRSAGWTDRA
jgi:hypothetical protein